MSLNNRSILFLKGMAMGISDLIPGISGGTIALLLGIYKDFISSLKSINYKSFIYLIKLDFKKLNNQLNLFFLLPVFFGILSSIFIFSSLISFLLLDYKVLLFSFFFGLIFFSSIRLISSLKPSFIFCRRNSLPTIVKKSALELKNYIFVTKYIQSIQHNEKIWFRRKGSNPPNAITFADFLDGIFELLSKLHCSYCSYSKNKFLTTLIPLKNFY